MKRLFTTLIILSFALAAEAQEVIRVLAIGNSFSQDMVEQNLHEIGRDEGTTIIVGNLYIGGCTLQKHLKNIRGNKNAYSYRKIGPDGKRVVTNKYSISRALTDEAWDYIMVQQQSGLSGVYASYGRYLPEIMKYLRENAPQSAKYIILQPWAYQGDSDHAQFAIYNHDQMAMYKSITKSVKRVFADPQYGFHAVIPAGTAIQNGRTSRLGDHLTRDGYHLHKGIGRYIGACTMCEVLLGRQLKASGYAPSSVSREDAALARRAAHVAVVKPWRVTKIK